MAELHTDSIPEHEFTYFSTCLPRNDLCTAEPQTIIYSSAQRHSVHQTRLDAFLHGQAKNRPPPLQTVAPPSKRSLSPLHEVQDFVQRWMSYHPQYVGEIQTQNPKPDNRPTSSSSQTHHDDERLTRSSYNIYLKGIDTQRAKGDILQYLKLHHQTFISVPHDLLVDENNVLLPRLAEQFDQVAVESAVELVICLSSHQNFTIFSGRKRNALLRGYLGAGEELKENSNDLIVILNGSLPSLEDGLIKLRILLDRLEARVCDLVDGVPHREHNLISGRRRSEFENRIEEIYNVTIYTHSPTVKVFRDDHYMERNYDRIYITGEKDNVFNAANELRDLVPSPFPSKTDR